MNKIKLEYFINIMKKVADNCVEFDDYLNQYDVSIGEFLDNIESYISYFKLYLNENQYEKYHEWLEYLTKWDYANLVNLESLECDLIPKEDSFKIYKKMKADNALFEKDWKAVSKKNKVAVKNRKKACEKAQKERDKNGK